MTYGSESECATHYTTAKLNLGSTETSIEFIVARGAWFTDSFDASVCDNARCVVCGTLNNTAGMNINGRVIVIMRWIKDEWATGTLIHRDHGPCTCKVRGNIIPFAVSHVREKCGPSKVLTVRDIQYSFHLFGLIEGPEMRVTWKLCILCIVCGRIRQ